MRHPKPTEFMLTLHVKNETAPLEAVVLGIAKSPGPIPTIEEAYDPKSKEHIRAGTYPLEADMMKELQAFEAVFEKYGVKVYRPELLEDINQIFSRDIAFVIDDILVLANVLDDRSEEIKAIRYLVDEVAPEKVLEVPADARVEGGDVMPWNGKLFVGYSNSEDFARYKVARTNEAGLDFLRQQFPQWELHGFELIKSDEDPYRNALHLDCCFQPIGRDQAIIFPGGFKHQEDVDFLKEFFGRDRLLEIDREEMYHMCSNVFSISPEVIVSENRFERLNSRLRERGFTVESIPYHEIGKQEGLLRCSTMPLRRKYE